MDPNEYVEVTIIEPASKIPTVNDVKASPTQILSTVHGRESTRQEISKVTPENFASFRPQCIAFQKPNAKLDIDLLLRLYACNSNMEKSIERVITEADRKHSCTSRSLLAKDMPRIELNAACKIFGNSRCREIANVLEYLSGRYSDEVLLNNLAGDSTLKICKFCGVISYSKPSGVPRSKFSSRNAYFLHTTDSVNQNKYNTKQRNINFHPGMQKLFVEAGNASDFQSSSLILKRHGEFDYRSIENGGIMTAERESDIILKEQRAGKVNNARTACPSLAAERRFDLTRIEERTDITNKTSTRIKHSVTGWSNETNSFRAKYCNEEVEKEIKPNGNLAERCLDETRRNEIRSERTTEFQVHARLPNLEHPSIVQSSKRTQQSLINPDNIRSTANAVKHLASIAFANETEKESVSQLNERACDPSSFTNKRCSFALHRPRESGPRLDGGFRLHDEIFRCSHDEERTERFRLKECGSLDSVESQVAENLMCEVENDSLEDCRPVTQLRPGESDTTAFSSSSAENMIREWVKPLWKDGEERKERNDLNREISNWERSIIAKPVEIRRRKLMSVELRPENSKEKNISGFTDCVFHFEKLLDSKIAMDDAGKGQSSSDKCLDSGTKLKLHSLNENQKPPSVNFPTAKSPRNVDKGKRLLSNDHFQDLPRRISYDEAFLKSVLRTDASYETIAEISSLYHEVLQRSEGLDWQEFQRFVANLHPGQKDLWLGVCQAVNAAASRAGDKVTGIELCIEISPVLRGKRAKGVNACDNTIMFEVDTSLGNLERILGKREPPTKRAQLDIHKNLNGDIKVRNDDVWNTEVGSNKPE